MVTPHVSPSQVATHRGCARKWAYSRIRPRSESEAAAFGTRAHLVAEAWLEHGTPPDPATKEGRCILSGVADLPLPGQALVEHAFDRHEMFGIPWTGRIDFIYNHIPGERVTIGDHKTTGNLNYSLVSAMSCAGCVDRQLGYDCPIHGDDPTERGRDFAHDPQRIVYSHYAATVLGVREVTAHWQYYLRNGKRSIPVFFTEDAPSIRDRFLDLLSKDAAPIVFGAGQPVESFPRSLDHCSAYGRCPYADECLAGVSDLQLATAAMARSNRVKTAHNQAGHRQ